jgi:hypothetical protein
MVYSFDYQQIWASRGYQWGLRVGTGEGKQGLRGLKTMEETGVEDGFSKHQERAKTKKR